MGEVDKFGQVDQRLWYRKTFTLMLITNPETVQEDMPGEPTSQAAISWAEDHCNSFSHTTHIVVLAWAYMRLLHNLIHYSCSLIFWHIQHSKTIKHGFTDCPMLELLYDMKCAPVSNVGGHTTTTIDILARLARAFRSKYCKTGLHSLVKKSRQMPVALNCCNLLDKMSMQTVGSFLKFQEQSYLQTATSESGTGRHLECDREWGDDTGWSKNPQVHLQQYYTIVPCRSVITRVFP